MISPKSFIWRGPLLLLAVFLGVSPFQAQATPITFDENLAEIADICYIKPFTYGEFTVTTFGGEPVGKFRPTPFLGVQNAWNFVGAIDGIELGETKKVIQFDLYLETFRDRYQSFGIVMQIAGAMFQLDFQTQGSADNIVGVQGVPPDQWIDVTIVVDPATQSIELTVAGIEISPIFKIFDSSIDTLSLAGSYRMREGNAYIDNLDFDAELPGGETRYTADFSNDDIWGFYSDYQNLGWEEWADGVEDYLIGTSLGHVAYETVGKTAAGAVVNKAIAVSTVMDLLNLIGDTQAIDVPTATPVLLQPATAFGQENVEVFQGSGLSWGFWFSPGAQQHLPEDIVVQIESRGFYFISIEKEYSLKELMPDGLFEEVFQADRGVFIGFKSQLGIPVIENDWLWLWPSATLRIIPVSELERDGDDLVYKPYALFDYYTVPKLKLDISKPEDEEIPGLERGYYDEYYPWIYTDYSGWQYVWPTDSGAVWTYSAYLEAYVYKGSHYPWVYISFDDTVWNGWYYDYGGSAPERRWYYRYSSQEYIRASVLRAEGK